MSTTVTQTVSGSNTTTTIATKPGYKTTEFWLALVTIIIGQIYASGVVVDGGTLAKVLALATSALAAAGYSVSRGLSKGGAAGAAS